MMHPRRLPHSFDHWTTLSNRTQTKLLSLIRYSGDRAVGFPQAYALYIDLSHASLVISRYTAAQWVSMKTLENACILAPPDLSLTAPTAATAPAGAHSSIPRDLTWICWLLRSRLYRRLLWLNAGWNAHKQRHRRQELRHKPIPA